jgi:transposase-like protein
MGRTRRKYTAAFKVKVALEAIKEQKTLNELAKIYEVHPTQITNWKKQFLDHSPAIFDDSHESSQRDLQREIDELHRIIGRLNVENDFLKKKVL